MDFEMIVFYILKDQSGTNQFQYLCFDMAAVSRKFLNEKQLLKAYYRQSNITYLTDAI